MKQISDFELEQAIANPNNQTMIKKVCSFYSRLLSPSILKSCGDTAVWRCLRSHRDDMGQKFTSSLFRFVHWECLRELSNSKCSTISYIDDNASYVSDPSQTLIIQELLGTLSEEARQIVVARYIENCTLAEIGNRHNYSKQGIQNILARSIRGMKSTTEC